MTRVGDLGPYHPARHARARPDAVALRLTGWDAADPDRGRLTWSEVVDQSARLARAFQDAGLEVGDSVAVCSTNRLEMVVAAWAALRSGLYCTPISTWLGPDEAAYIARDCGAKALVASIDPDGLAAGIRARQRVALAVSIGGHVDGFVEWDSVLAGFDGHLLDREVEGSMMLYSSGATGRPKGVRRPLSGAVAGTSNPLEPFAPRVGLGPDTVYLSPAPMYHAAPLGWSLGTMRAGGAVVVLPRFDATLALSAIESHRVTLAQFVPTMLRRLLQLPAAVRDAYDLSSLRRIVHAAAPCPPHVKRAMIDWLGPIVDEYYSGTEGSGTTYITSEEWLAHPGSVGRPILGEIRVTDEEGNVVGSAEEGIIWFAGGGSYEYHGDDAATHARRHAQGWTTLDDIGFVDDDGYLFLTDRRAHMIVSGGVNISPREVEDVLLEHGAVDDVAVIGVPDDDLGEVVKAVVTVCAGDDRADLADRLIAHCRSRLARHKVPRTVDIVDELPRLPTGKLAKRELREQYRSGARLV